MKFQAKGGSDFEPCPAGNHSAICNAVVDLGLQPGSGIYPEPKHMVYIRFELPGERIDYTKDGKRITGPMSIGRRFTASMSNKANLRKFIEGWFGKKFPTDDVASSFDLMQLIDKKCLLNVTHDVRGDRTYANIAGASPMPKGMPNNFQRENDALMFDLSDPDEEMFALLPQWLMELINKRLDAKKPEITAAATSSKAPTGNKPGFDPSRRATTTDTGLATAEATDFDDDIPY